MYLALSLATGKNLALTVTPQPQASFLISISRSFCFGTSHGHPPNTPKGGVKSIHQKAATNMTATVAPPT